MSQTPTQLGRPALASQHLGEERLRSCQGDVDGLEEATEAEADDARS